MQLLPCDEELGENGCFVGTEEGVRILGGHQPQGRSRHPMKLLDIQISQHRERQQGASLVDMQLCIPAEVQPLQGVLHP